MFGKKNVTLGIATMKETSGNHPARDGVISIIGPGMRVIGDCITEGTLRIEGTVEGSIRAEKAVVIGKEGVVIGDIQTQDAVVGGRVEGRIFAESRLELQSTCVISGDVHARRIKLDEGGQVVGTLQMVDRSATSSRPFQAADAEDTEELVGAD